MYALSTVHCTAEFQLYSVLIIYCTVYNIAAITLHLALSTDCVVIIFTMKAEYTVQCNLSGTQSYTVHVYTEHSAVQSYLCPSRENILRLVKLNSRVQICSRLVQIWDALLQLGNSAILTKSKSLWKS